MILVVGLGNPGDKYKNNRHNLGFMLIDKILDSSFIKQKLNCNGTLYKKNNLLLLKPETYMNESGKSVLQVCNFYNPDRVIVCHDEMDIPFTSLRMKNAGSSGGHNGLRSIDACIGNNYERVRLGIGKPEIKSDVINFVLGDFNKEESEKLDDFLEYSKEALICLINNNLTTAQNKYNR